MATPLFQAAGLAPSSVRIHLVDDSALNAFVADGQRLFINTGLLMRAGSASQVIGVIAHETGHIAGGHLSRLGKEQRAVSAKALIATVIGAAAGLATGRGDVAGAVISGGQSTAVRGFLSFSRGQEASADQAALTLLDQTKQSSRGLLEFMEVLEGQELLTGASQDPYVRTHPLSEDRIQAIRAHMQSSPYADKPVDPAITLAFDRVRAKLVGYFEPPSITLRKYPLDDTSIPARYARAFAYSRIPEPQKAIAELDGLLRDVPDDPYFLELKAQVLYESGNIQEAVAPFRRAVELKPEEPLLRTELSRILTESNNKEYIEEAVEHLKFGLSRDGRSASAWRLLGIAYGKLGDIGRSSLALAEEALLLGKDSEVRFHAGRAAEMFPRGSPEWLQAEDMLLALKNRKE
ncbi:MAG: M48 family metalloprotease [Rhodospirillales bacterium]|nr:M48 family metalloprotease [Rhodospirillales bacterium]MBO6785831.1 M48 family metalloprotease [Rhodospirillales bacterium]